MADRPYTAIDNVVFDALLSAPLHHRQKTVCFAVLRLTVGFGGQPMRAFSLELLARVCDVPAKKLRALLVELQAQGIVLRRDGGQGRRAAWGIAPDPRSWQLALRSTPPLAGEEIPLPLAGRGQVPPLPLEGRGPLPLEGSPGKETSEKKEEIQNDGGRAVVVRAVASLAEEDLIGAAKPSFVAYGKQTDSWGEGRVAKLRDRALELARRGRSLEEVLAAIAHAPHGFLWFHRSVETTSRFKPWRLFTPDTVYGEGFDQYLDAYGEARRAGKQAPFTTRHAQPAPPARRAAATAAALPAPRKLTELELAQVQAGTALRHHLRRIPTEAEIEAEYARVAAELAARERVA